MTETLTPILVERAVAMRELGAGWGYIAKVLGVSEYAIHCWLEPGYRRYKRGLGNGEKRKRPKVSHATRHAVHSYLRRMPPDEVLAERELALHEEQSITAQLLGDPPPSRSALGRRP